MVLSLNYLGKMLKNELGGVGVIDYLESVSLSQKGPGVKLIWERVIIIYRWKN
jgi:hypothetical protein